MLDASHAASVAGPGEAVEPDVAPTGSNITTKAELLSRAKQRSRLANISLHDAAEALGVAQELHSATQREMAEAVGKSASWVNKLLKWRQSGYKDHSPFGATTKSGRVEHAQQRAKASKPHKTGTESQATADDPEVSAAKRKAEYANQETETALAGEAR